MGIRIPRNCPPEAYFKVDTYALVTVEIQSWSEPVVHGGGTALAAFMYDAMGKEVFL